MYDLKPNSCPGICHFIQDRNDPDRYTCLPCGKVRYTTHGCSVSFLFAVIPAFIIILIFIAGCGFSSEIDDSLHGDAAHLEQEKS